MEWGQVGTNKRGLTIYWNPRNWECSRFQSSCRAKCPWWGMQGSNIAPWDHLGAQFWMVAWPWAIFSSAISLGTFHSKTTLWFETFPTTPGKNVVGLGIWDFIRSNMDNLRGKIGLGSNLYFPQKSLESYNLLEFWNVVKRVFWDHLCRVQRP